MSRKKLETGRSVPEDSISDRQLQALEQIRDALRGLRYGQVTIIVQDGVVVQIDRTERKRLA
jgi:hypothetical protein